MGKTWVRQHVNAPRARVYRALLDPDAIARWPGATSASPRAYSHP